MNDLIARMTDPSHWIIEGPQYGAAKRKYLDAMESCGLSTLRSSEGVKAVTENKSHDFVQQAWMTVCELLPEAVDMADFIREVERKIPSGHPHGSPGFMEFCAHAALCRWLCGPLHGMKIAEIGAGWGGLAAILTHLFCVQDYMIFDLPVACEMQRKAMQAIQAGPIRWSDQLDVIPDEYDLVIAFSSLCELDTEGRELYGTHVLSKADSGLVFWSHPPQQADGFLDPSPNSVMEWLERFVSKTIHWGGNPPFPQHRGFRVAYYWI